MDFRKPRRDEPEINLIPFIDVLLVVLIFLMVTTTFNRLTALDLTLPTASTQPLAQKPQEVVVAVAADGRYAINQRVVDGRSVEALAAELRGATQNLSQPVVIISADATAAHQSVINVLDAARRAGLSRLTFASQSGDPR
ncbi:ExbD/TolR family protein [Azohydromonas caseinilytica]|uniref:Biopolymer transporter ExbD n=1 Tax=Azohydromonas caseinilytica TaxID=2728836 RepID=A0A848F5W9_9BURK|nr:biopolymer transporter ExbD [Azohydromonas caseinilytica]NML15467.1 biopolymer transporter ExbD [Azohydromonas caseinilytica]